MALFSKNSGNDQQGPGPGPMKPGELPTAGYIKKLWKTGTQDRRIVDRETWTNLAFIAGEHYAQWDPKQQRFFAPPANDRQLRLKVNILLDKWREEIAQMTAGKPIPECLPVTSEDMDRQVAMTAQRILDHELDRLQFDNKRLEEVMWTTSAGISYMHPWWNPDEGNEGEVCVDVIPHFEIVTDPACRFGVHEGQYVIHGRVLTEEEYFERFGEEAKAQSEDTPYSWAQLFTNGANATNPNRKGILVLRMWHKPSRKFPDGFVITAADDKIVEEITPYPYDHGELPFVDFHHIRIPGRFEGQSMLVSLVPVQRDYNHSRSRMAELRKFQTSPGWIAPRGSLDVGRMTDMPGEVVEWDPVGPYEPKMREMPTVPNFLFQTTETAKHEMDDISGQHDTGGNSVSGTSGAAIMAIHEKDGRKLATTLSQQETGIARVGGQVLGLVKQYWDTPRALRAWGEELDESGVTFFKGEDIQGGYHVRVVPGSALPKSKTQHAQMLMELFQNHVVEDPVWLVKQLDLPSADQLVDTMSVDRRQAKREHDRIFKADPLDQVLVEGFHNHMEHIRVHNDFRKTETFEKWPQQLKAFLADHVNTHYQEAQDMRQQSIQMAVQEQVGVQTQMAEAFTAATGTPPQGKEYLNPPGGMPQSIPTPPAGPAPAGGGGAPAGPPR